MFLSGNTGFTVAPKIHGWWNLEVCVCICASLENFSRGRLKLRRSSKRTFSKLYLTLPFFYFFNSTLRISLYELQKRSLTWSVYQASPGLMQLYKAVLMGLMRRRNQLSCYSSAALFAFWVPAACHYCIVFLQILHCVKQGALWGKVWEEVEIPCKAVGLFHTRSGIEDLVTF